MKGNILKSFGELGRFWGVPKEEREYRPTIYDVESIMMSADKICYHHRNLDIADVLTMQVCLANEEDNHDYIELLNEQCSYEYIAYEVKLDNLVKYLDNEILKTGKDKQKIKYDKQKIKIIEKFPEKIKRNLWRNNAVVTWMNIYQSKNKKRTKKK